MTRDDIIRMARVAGFAVNEKARQHQPNCIFHTQYMVDELLERFAAIVRADEREACAKVVEAVDDACPECAAHNEHDQCVVPQAWEYAAAIQARGQA